MWSVSSCFLVPAQVSLAYLLMNLLMNQFLKFLEKPIPLFQIGSEGASAPAVKFAQVMMGSLSGECTTSKHRPLPGNGDSHDTMAFAPFYRTIPGDGPHVRTWTSAGPSEPMTPLHPLLLSECSRPSRRFLVRPSSPPDPCRPALHSGRPRYALEADGWLIDGCHSGPDPPMC